MLVITGFYCYPFGIPYQQHCATALHSNPHVHHCVCTCVLVCVCVSILPACVCSCDLCFASCFWPAKSTTTISRQTQKNTANSLHNHLQQQLDHHQQQLNYHRGECPLLVKSRNTQTTSPDQLAPSTFGSATHCNSRRGVCLC